MSSTPIKRHLAGSERHASSCHRRWLGRVNRAVDSADYQEAWFSEQCGGCAYYVRLAGALASDWGACTNQSSACDGTVRYEHDGCEHFIAAKGGW